MPGPSKTPAQIRYPNTHSANVGGTPLGLGDPALRPMLVQARNPGEESEAFSEWLGHLAAGRIVVR